MFERGGPMPLIRDNAIVLKRLDFSESSQVLALFSHHHGKVRVIAKGVRRSTKKRFSPGIDLLESGEAVLSVRQARQETLAILTEWTGAVSYHGLRERLDRLNAAQYAADIVAGLTGDWDPHPGMYLDFDRALAALADADRPQSVLVWFQRSVLADVGLSPRLDGCVSCGRGLRGDGDVYFSSFEGGLLCRDCEPSRVEKRLVRVAPDVLSGGAPSSDADVAGVFDVLNYHVSHLMGRAPAAAAFFEGPSGRGPSR